MHSELHTVNREVSMQFMSTVRALSEACQLAYMSGRWVHTDRYGNTLIRIVESTLPGNGDYSAGVTSGKWCTGVVAALCAFSDLKYLDFISLPCNISRREKQDENQKGFA